jgi:hypothetical protein
MNAYAAPGPHPFEVGDRVFWPGPANHGFKKFARRLHCVERSWTKRSEFHTLHYIKVIGIDRPVCANQFVLVNRAGGVAA